MQVPSDKHSVFSDDGRLFYDLPHLIAHYNDILVNVERGVEIMGTESEKEYVAGQRWLLSQIQSAADKLIAERILAES